MSLLHTVVAFIVALGVLIVVHEYGHYLVARLCGVKVLRFSVGFGRALLVKRIGKDRTEWVISAIPFGGYVKMLDEREGPVAPQDLPRAFNRQSVGKRFAIVIAGVLGAVPARPAETLADVMEADARARGEAQKRVMALAA